MVGLAPVSLTISQASPVPARHPRWWRQGAATLRLWHQRSRARRELGQLTAFDLRDIGVTPSEAQQEMSQPFWR